MTTKEYIGNGLTKLVLDNSETEWGRTVRDAVAAALIDEQIVKSGDEVVTSWKLHVWIEGENNEQ